MRLTSKKHISVSVVFFILFSLFPTSFAFSAAAPKLIITSIGTNPSSPDAGASFDATVYIKNIGDKAAKNIRISINKSAAVSPFAPYKTGSTVYVSVPGDELKKNEEVSQTFKLGSNGAASPGINNLYLTLEYEDIDGQSYQNEQVVGIPLEKPEEKPKYEPRLVISRVQTSPGQVEAGQNFSLTMDITNFGNETAKSVKVTATEVEGMNGLQVLSPVSQSNSIYINTIDDGKSKTETLQFSVSHKAEPKRYNIKIDLEYRDIYGQVYRCSEVVSVTVTKDGLAYREDAKPQLSVSGYQLSKSPVTAGQNFDLSLEISNPTKTTAQNVKLTLEGSGNEPNVLTTTRTGNTIFISRIDKYSTVTKTIPLGINKNAASGRNNINITLDYTDDYGQTYESKEFISIPVINPDDNKFLKQPKIMIADCRLASEKIEAGKPFDVELVVQNIGGETAQNVSLTLSNVQGEQGLTVFAPLKSSNALFVSELGPRQTRTLKQKMYVSGEAMSKVYNIVVTVDYQDREGKPLNHQEVIGIPVIQDQSLQVTTFDYPQKVKPGQEIKIYSDFINMGKHPIENLLISFTGNFEVDYPTYFVGKFDVGSSEVFETTAKISKPGTYTGKVTFTYMNDYRQQTNIEKTITIVVEEPKQVTTASVKNKSESGFWAWLKRIILAIFGLGN